MNNIQKLLLGVLTISGLLAMLVPSGSPIAPPGPTEAPPTVAPSVPVPEAAIEDNQNVAQVEGFDVPEVKFGEPSISGLPFGSENAPPVNQDAPPIINEKVQSQPETGNADDSDSDVT